jgi:hypothetical protein
MSGYETGPGDWLGPEEEYGRRHRRPAISARVVSRSKRPGAVALVGRFKVDRTRP